MFNFRRPAPTAAGRAASASTRIHAGSAGGCSPASSSGYAAYYLVRNNLALAIPDILREHPDTQQGTARLGAHRPCRWRTASRSSSWVRCRTAAIPKYFLPLGLLLSCAIMFVGARQGASTPRSALLIVLQTINGWVQGMGWPPCGKTMVHWFSTQRARAGRLGLERRRTTSAAALVANFALLGVALFDDWGAKFYFNAVDRRGRRHRGRSSCMRDTPQSLRPSAGRGIPERLPRRTTARITSARSRYREIFLDHVLTNRYLWAIAVANAFVYFVRYGVVNWIPTYLQTAKGFSFQQSSLGWALYEYAAIPGTIACGWMSDRVFKGRRAPATMLFMALTLVARRGLLAQLRGPLWIDYAALIAIGFLIYGPIMIIGLHALDLVPKKAAGTAAGFTGFFGYVFGSAIAGTGVGWIADNWGWNGVFMTMVACCVLTIVFSAMTLGHTVESGGRHA